MKITRVETLLIDRYLFVQVHTDAGITGLGESGAWGYLEASAQAIDKFARYLVGQDPLRIEHHWQYLYRWSHTEQSLSVYSHWTATPSRLLLWDVE